MDEVDEMVGLRHDPGKDALQILASEFMPTFLVECNYIFLVKKGHVQKENVVDMKHKQNAIAKSTLQLFQ